MSELSKSMSPIVAKIASLTKNDIKDIVPAVTYTRGHAYFKKNAVTHISWDATHSALKGAVLGSKKYAVGCSLNTNGTITTTCNCPAANTMETCKHAIAFLLTINDLMHTDTTHISERLQIFKKTVMGTQTEAQNTPSVLTGATDSVRDVSIKVQSKKKQVEFHIGKKNNAGGHNIWAEAFYGVHKKPTTVPVPIKELFSRLQFTFAQDRPFYIRKLMDTIAQHTCIVHTQEGTLPVSVDLTHEIMPVTKITVLDENRLEVRPQASANGAVIESIVPLFNETYCIDLKAAKIGTVVSNMYHERWHFALRWKQYPSQNEIDTQNVSDAISPLSTAYTIDAHTFNVELPIRYEITKKKLLNNFVFDTKPEYSLKPLTTEYGINISLDKGNVQATLSVMSSPSSDVAQALLTFIAKEYQDFRAELGMSRKIKDPLLAGAILAHMYARIIDHKRGEKLIKKATDQTKSLFLRGKLKEYGSIFANTFLTSKPSESIVLYKQQLYTCTWIYEKWYKGLALVYDLFNTDCTVDMAHGTIAVSAQKMHQCLHALQKVCRNHNVSLFFEEKTHYACKIRYRYTRQE